MLQADQVRQSHKRLPEDLKEGDVIVASQSSGDEFKGILYTVQQVFPLNAEDETITVECRYDFDGKALVSQTRTFGFKRFDYVTTL